MQNPQIHNSLLRLNSNGLWHILFTNVFCSDSFWSLHASLPSQFHQVTAKCSNQWMRPASYPIQPATAILTRWTNELNWAKALQWHFHKVQAARYSKRSQVPSLTCKIPISYEHTYHGWTYIYIYYYTYMTYIHINNMYNSLIIIYCILYKPETGWDAQTLMVMIDPPLLDPSLGDTRDSKDHGDSAQSTSWSNPGDPSLWWLSKTHEQTLCIRPPWHLVCLVVSVVRSDEVLWQETEVSSPRHQQSEDDLTKK